MRFIETKLSGAFVIEIEPRVDERGAFARTWCRREFAAHGILAEFVQANMSLNSHGGTLRGLHYQRAPHEEAKFVRCERGAIYDVIVDLRPGSKTYAKWVGVELDQVSGRMLFIPEGFAHGFQTLADDTEVSYLVTAYYAPASEAGIRYDDPVLGIPWPRTISRISDKDRAWPRLAEAANAA